MGIATPVSAVRSKGLQAIVYIVLVLDILMNAIYYISCRSSLPVMTMLLLGIELMYYIIFADKIYAGCDTDAEKVQAFYKWITSNFEYDYIPTDRDQTKSKLMPLNTIAAQ